MRYRKSTDFITGTSGGPPKHGEVALVDLPARGGNCANSSQHEATGHTASRVRDRSNLAAKRAPFTVGGEMGFSIGTHYQRQRTKGQSARVNRGAALAGNRVFMVTDDARLIALNRFTGELLWDTVMAD